MKKMFTAVAVVLAVLMAAFATALPAQAAPAAAAKPSLSMFATSDDATSSYRYFYITAENLDGKKVTLQVSTGTEWKNVYSYTVTGSSEQIGVEHQRTAAGKYKYRAVVLSGATVVTASNTVDAPFTPPPPPATMDISLRGNVVDVKVTNGKGLLVKLYRVDKGRKLLWSAAKPATTNSYTVSVPITVSTGTEMAVQAVGYLGTEQVSDSGTMHFWASPPAPVGFFNPEYDYEAKKTVQILGDIADGATVSLQRLTGKTWVTVWTSKPVAAGQENPTATYTFPAEATASFRIIQTQGGKVTATSGVSSMTFAKLNSELRSATWGDMFATAEGRVAAKTSISQTYFLDVALADRKGYFQEYKGGKWVTLNTLTFKKSSGYSTAKGVTVKTPLTNATVTRKYRITLPATAREKAWTSKTATIAHMNPQHYSGYTKTAYNYMKKYCPNQVITLREPGASYAYWPSNRIEMARGMSGKSMQYVSLHECAHIREYGVYKDDHAGMNKRLNAIFGGTGSTGTERAADCMSYVMGADKKHGGTYLRNCSATQTAAAKKILSGKKP